MFVLLRSAAPVFLPLPAVQLQFCSRDPACVRGLGTGPLGCGDTTEIRIPKIVRCSRSPTGADGKNGVQHTSAKLAA